MTKKSRKEKNIEQADIEAEEKDIVPAESDQVASDAGLPVLEQSLSDEIQEGSENEEAGEGVPGSSAEASLDDILEDVRHSLIEEDAGKKEKKPKWWDRLVKGKQTNASPEPELSSNKDAGPSVMTASLPVETKPEEQEEYEEQIDELIKLLETDDDVEPDLATAPAEADHQTEQEVKIDIDELKKQAFSPRATVEEPEGYSEVRAVALDGGEEVFVEVEAKPVNPLDDRVNAIENALRPYRKYIYYGVAFLGVVMAVIALMMVYNVYQQSRPEPQATEAVSLPYPVSIELPGGLNFNLGQGALDDGEWNPRGPEWLEGTEICRWVSIPWSKQLEAVIRTFTQDDEITLLMSNNDRLVYKVYSRRQLTIADMQKLDSDSPCLLLVLADAKSEERWVITALP